ncbi:MAG: cytosine permease [Clostridiales Family XIII bacterium]|jgi:cytosine permease|nr:cytosine permease [Clostridiales Family XIII bacterium]
MAKEKGIVFEKLALRPVPRDQRQGWISVALIQAGFMISATSLWAGSLMIAGMSLVETAIAAVIGYVIVVAICFAQGIMGSDIGVPSIVVATQSFGDRGSQFLVSTISAVCCIGWFGINANICGAAFSGLMSSSFDVEIPVKVSIIIWGVIMFSTAVIGFNGLKILNYIAVPAMVAVTVVGLYIVASGDGIDAIRSFIPYDPDMTMGVGIDMVIGGFIVGAVLPADYTRYQKTRRDVFKSSFFGILPLGVILLLAGAVFAIAAGTEDLTNIFIGLGIPLFGLLSLILSTWPANAANIYSAGLATMKVFWLKDNKRIPVTLLCGILGTAVGSFEIIFYFETFLTYLGIIIAPIAGVMMVDYFIIGKGKPENWAPTVGVNWRGIIALAAGIVVSIFVPVGIESVNGVIVSAVVLLVLDKVMPKPATTSLEALDKSEEAAGEPEKEGII